MDKYLVKPTQIIGENGNIYNTNNLDQSPAIIELTKKIDNVVLDTTGLSEVRKRVYDLESLNKEMNNKIFDNEATCADALNVANIAHNAVTSMVTDFNQISKIAVNAETKAVEAKSSISSINADYESLKDRVEVLENLDGTDVVIVGPQTMGSESMNSYTCKWMNGREVRSLNYGPNDTLDQVIEWIHEPLANGITDHENRIAALEATGGSGTGSVDLSSINSTLTALSSSVNSHTNSIQTLDTRTSSHAASIGSLETRMTDTERQVSVNKSDIAALRTSWGISHIGDLYIKEDKSTFYYVNHLEENNPTYAFTSLTDAFDLLMPLITEITSQIEDIWHEIDTIQREISVMQS